MNYKSISFSIFLAVSLFLVISPSLALDRYETWIQGDTIRIAKGQTALVIFASPDCQVKMNRPGCKQVTLKIEPTAKVVPDKYRKTGAILRYEDKAIARITSPRNPVALVGPVVLTLENSTGPKLTTSYVSVIMTDTELPRN